MLRALARELGRSDVAEDVRVPRHKAGPPETITDSDFANLLRVPDRRTRHGKRDVALLRILGDCGLRAGELRGLLAGWIAVVAGAGSLATGMTRFVGFDQLIPDPVLFPAFALPASLWIAAVASSSGATPPGPDPYRVDPPPASDPRSGLETPSGRMTGCRPARELGSG